ncbi:MAG: hypothetical protein CL666_10635 [Balneola sp.]|nr:hypothetical protein [Balneola sp.]
MDFSLCRLNHIPRIVPAGTGSSITPQNMLGLEGGIQFSNTDFNQQFDIGQLLLRYGLTEQFEVRALLGSYTSFDQELLGGSRTVTGFQDMGIGAKYKLLSNESKIDLSALAEISLPVGSDEFTSNEVVPSIGLLADYAFHETLSFSSNLGYTLGVGDLEDHWLFTVTPGFTISDNVGGYFGYAGRYYGNFEQHWIEGGITFGLNSGVQLDANIGYDTENEITFIGAGFAKGF